MQRKVLSRVYRGLLSGILSAHRRKIAVVWISCPAFGINKAFAVGEANGNFIWVHDDCISFAVTIHVDKSCGDCAVVCVTHPGSTGQKSPAIRKAHSDPVGMNDDRIGLAITVYV